MEEQSSKILLDLENKNSSASIQSKLIVCKKNKNSIPIQSKRPSVDAKPTISLAPKSQVLGKVKDFLGIMSESNKKLQIDAANNPKGYDIEAITGEEKEYIELDLMLGVADLHTPEAVAAAESAVSSYQPVIQLNDTSDSDNSHTSDSDNSHSELESEDENSSDNDGNDDERCSSDEVLGNSRLKKRSKIVEIL